MEIGGDSTTEGGEFSGGERVGFLFRPTLGPASGDASYGTPPLQKEHAEAEVLKEDRRHDLARRIEQLDAQIDVLVYELYDLTEEEIRIVEEATGK